MDYTRFTVAGGREVHPLEAVDMGARPPRVKLLHGESVTAAPITTGLQNETSVEIRYFLNSVTSVKQFARAVRGHWGIENSEHYILDMAFDEDACRIRRDHGPKNFATLRHIALNLLRREPPAAAA